MRGDVRLQVVIVSILFSASAMAQESGPLLAPGQSSRRQHGVVASAAQVPARSATTLAERLKQIRQRMATEPQRPNPSSAPGPAARVAELPRTPGLRSVLKRRPAAPSSAAEPPSSPLSQSAPRELATADTEGISELTSPARTLSTDKNMLSKRSGSGPVDSSRRTARRTRNADIYSPSTPIGSTTATTESLALVRKSPAMRVETAGPKAIAIGKEARYRVRLINQGTDSAEHVIVTVTLSETVEILNATARLGTVGRPAPSANRQQLAWQIDALPGQSQNELEIRLRPKTNDPIALQVDWTFRPSSLSASIEVQQPKLDMQLVGPTEMQYGETRVFKIQVSNPGNGAAEDVVVNLAATGAASQPNRIGTLPAGATRQLELELKAGQAGVMEIRANARAAGNLSVNATHAVRVRRARLAVSVDAPQLLYAGAQANYRIQIANEGDALAKDVVLEVDLPRGAENGLGIDNQPMAATSAKWRVGNLEPGSRREYNVRCVLTAPGRNPVSARMQGTTGLTAADAATTQVEAIADLKLVVNDPKGPIPVGQEVTYEVQVINRGSKEAKNIAVVAQFSDGIEPTSASGQPSELVPGQVIFDPIQMLPAGGQITLKIKSRATNSGNLRFRAELTCPDPDTKLVAEETTRFYSRSMAGAAGNARVATPSTVPATAAKPPLAPTPARR